MEKQKGNFFTKHLVEVQESYPEHFRKAIWFSAQMLVGGLACGIHAVAPFLFTTTGSERIKLLHDKMVVNRHQRKD